MMITIYRFFLMFFIPAMLSRYCQTGRFYSCPAMKSIGGCRFFFVFVKATSHRASTVLARGDAHGATAHHRKARRA